MKRVSPVTYENADPKMRAEYDKQIKAHGRVTNMKQALGHSPAAFRALMEWYPLREEVLPFLGDRLTNLYCHAISSQTDCLICSTFFRRILVDSGENLKTFSLNAKEKTVCDYGRQLAKDPNQVSDLLYEALKKYFKSKEIVALTAFGAMMIATNIFNNALQIDLDDYLVPYKKKE